MRKPRLLAGVLAGKGVHVGVGRILVPFGGMSRAALPCAHLAQSNQGALVMSNETYIIRVDQVECGRYDNLHDALAACHSAELKPSRRTITKVRHGFGAVGGLVFDQKGKKAAKSYGDLAPVNHLTTVS